MVISQNDKGFTYNAHSDKYSSKEYFYFSHENWMSYERHKKGSMYRRFELLEHDNSIPSYDYGVSGSEYYTMNENEMSFRDTVRGICLWTRDYLMTQFVRVKLNTVKSNHVLEPANPQSE